MLFLSLIKMSSSSDILNWHTNCLFLSFGRIMSFWWQSCLWTSRIYRRAGHVAKFFFPLRTDAWFHFFQLAIFIPWLREQLPWVMYSVSTEFVYSSPGHVGICQLSADEIHLFLFQRQTQSYCKYSTTSEKDQFWEEELNLSLKLNLGKTEVVLSDVPIFSRKHSPFPLSPKA